MTELSGTLAGVGLPAIVRFLVGLKKTGRLHLVDADWRGEIVFAAGQVTDASFGSRSGLIALEALVQVLPEASFTFDTSPGASMATTIESTPEALQSHLDALDARVADGTPDLPSVGAVPTLVVQTDSAATEDRLPLDRGTLQTLLTVGGHRTVRQIVAQRGSFDALWQLGRLGEVGLVCLGAVSQIDGRHSTDRSTATPREPVRVEAAAPDVAPIVERPSDLAGEPGKAAERCPKLGFEDDPANSFARPTRLHRCFAADAPLPLSLDQQRELCLSDHFGTCPRLSMAGRAASRPSVRDFRTPSKVVRVAGNAALGAVGGVDPVPDEPTADNPRIVHLPIAGRKNVSPPDREAGDRQTDTYSEPAQLLPGAAARHAGDAPPTPLRTRIERSSGAGDSATWTSGDAGAAVSATPSRNADATAAPAPGFERAGPGGRLGSLMRPGFSAVSVPLGAAAVAAVVALAVLTYLVAPHLVSLFVDDSADLSGLPNASAVAAGTSVAKVAVQRTVVPAVVPSQVVGTGGAAAPVAATLVPEVAAAVTALPKTALSQTAPPQTVASASPAVAAPAQAGGSTLLPAAATLFDEKFATNAHNWPSDPQGTAWLTGGSYHLIPHQAGQFVAIGAPLRGVPADVRVSATFRKLDGTPAGGGFGIILRDQGTVPLDGTSQSGQYYVLEVGDKGEVGIWRRDTDHWVDLVPWQHADAVHPGISTNELTVTAVGSRLSLSVNGTPVITRTDASLPTGGVGIMVGGDGNQIAVDHFSVQTP